jgi:predicted ATPase with chaperone activity
MVIVGLPDVAVQVSRERVQSAIKNAGLYCPRKRITVNLAPVSVRKEGPACDQFIALAVLIAAGHLCSSLIYRPPSTECHWPGRFRRWDRCRWQSRGPKQC